MPMRSPFLMVGLLLSTSAFAGESLRRNLAQAGDRLEEAQQRNFRSPAGCRRNTDGPLQQLVDAVDGLKASDDITRFDQVAASLAALSTSARMSGCPDDVVRELGKAMGDFSDAVSLARQRRNGPPIPPPPQQAGPGITFGNPEITEPGPPGPIVAIPTITLSGYQGQNVYLAWHWQPQNGAWSQWESLPAVAVNNAYFVWNNPYRQILDYGLLKSVDTGQGRFNVHAGVFDMNGRELAGVDLSVTAHYPQFQQRPPGSSPFRRMDPNMPPPPPPGQVLPPPPPIAPQPAPRDCGLGLDDPGCALARAGGQAMERAAWEGFFSAVHNNISESNKLAMIRDTLRSRFVTARQLGKLMDEFIGENNKMDCARFAAPHLIDPDNALGFSTKFISSSRQREYNGLISGQR